MLFNYLIIINILIIFNNILILLFICLFKAILNFLLLDRENLCQAVYSCGSD